MARESELAASSNEAASGDHSGTANERCVETPALRPARHRGAAHSSRTANIVQTLSGYRQAGDSQCLCGSAPPHQSRNREVANESRIILVLPRVNSKFPHASLSFIWPVGWSLHEEVETGRQKVTARTKSGDPKVGSRRRIQKLEPLEALVQLSISIPGGRLRARIDGEFLRRFQK